MTVTATMVRTVTMAAMATVATNETSPRVVRSDAERRPTQYRLLTTWRIEAPLEDVYSAIRDSKRWPSWWPAVHKVDQTSAGDADGVNSVWRYSWQGRLPYQIGFEVSATRVERLVAIEGTARGDLEGTGRWLFDHEGAATVVRCEWQVHSTRWWMNLIAPVARSIFIRNHALVMKQGGEGLARLLGVPLLSQETVDLLAAGTPSAPTVHGRRRQHGRIDPTMALLVGSGAAVIATGAQLIFWWMAGMPVLETLFRDARLTAALIMGTSVLPPPSTAQWDILLVATLIHFSLSIAYAAVAAYFVGRLHTGPALVAGAAYGLVIYVVNLYGFTVLFPWFLVARDWVTLGTHVVFGVVLAIGYQLYSKHA
jgi:uncharacterized protein YndB with AHSA1/START domain